MTILTEDILHSHATETSFERGYEYYQSGAIYNTFRQGNTLLAKCVGTETYHLQVELDESGIQSASCSCPYNFGGYCKHLVALLLTYIHKPGEFTERKTIAALLENVDKAALVAILTKLNKRQPELYNWLEIALPAPIIAVSPSPSRPITQVSEAAWRKRIKNILRTGGYSDYESSYDISSDINEIINSATQILATGDAQGAITILLILLTELSEIYETLDDSDGNLADSAAEAGEILAEAILSADLDAQESQSIKDKLSLITKELFCYDIEDGLKIAQLAIKYGWKTHPEVSDNCTGLDSAKLNVLERKGRTPEFLTLCQQTNEYLRYTLKLLQLGRKDEALRAAYQISDPTQILEIAQKLREDQQLPEAIRLAEYGLTLTGQKHLLAIWLAPLEEIQGRPDSALQAYLISFAEAPNLETYKHLQRLSGEHWQQMKAAQMDILLKSDRSEKIIDVYLYEQEWDKAIAIAEKDSYNYTLREKVADAVIAHRPDWVIRISIREAEELIASTKSKYYPNAVHWLEKTKQAYLLSGRKAEWLAYFTHLKTTYSRRPALQSELKKLA